MTRKNDQTGIGYIEPIKQMLFINVGHETYDEANRVTG